MGMMRRADGQKAVCPLRAVESHSQNQLSAARRGACLPRKVGHAQESVRGPAGPSSDPRHDHCPHARARPHLRDDLGAVLPHLLPPLDGAIDPVGGPAGQGAPCHIGRRRRRCRWPWAWQEPVPGRHNRKASGCHGAPKSPTILRFGVRGGIRTHDPRIHPTSAFAAAARRTAFVVWTVPSP